MNNKKKNNLDEVNLVQALSDIVNMEKLSEFELSFTQLFEKKS